MRKPDSLRAAIAAAIPDFAANPDRLIMWIDRGSVIGRGTPSDNFGYSYRLNILVTGFSGHQAVIAIAILDWLRINQPDLLAPGKDAFTFEADYLDNRTIDLALELQLTEAVRVTRRDDGGFDMVIADEPDPLFDDDRPLGAATPPPPLRQIWFEGERLQPDAPLP